MDKNYGWQSRPYGWSPKAPKRRLSSFFTVGDFSYTFSPLLSVLVLGGKRKRGIWAGKPTTSPSNITSHTPVFCPHQLCEDAEEDQHPAIPFNASRLAWSRSVAFQSQLLQPGFALSCWVVMEAWSPLNLRQLRKGEGDRISYCFPKLIQLFLHIRHPQQDALVQ